MRSRSMSFLLPAIALLCACILPIGAGAQPVPAIAPPTPAQPAVIGVDLGADVGSEAITVLVSPFDRVSPAARLVKVKSPLDGASYWAFRDVFSFTADARLPTVPGVTVGGGSSG